MATVIQKKEDSSKLDVMSIFSDEQISILNDYAHSYSDLLKKFDKDSEVLIETGYTEKMNSIMNYFISSANNELNSVEAYLQIASYVCKYYRISYASITNHIFSFVKDKPPKDNIVSNFQKLLDFSSSLDVCKLSDETCKLMRRVHIVIFKMWDHVSLAEHQYYVLKQTDAEYEQKFNKHMKKYDENFMQNVNAHMITIVSIFTALAFILFGGVASLDNFFSCKMGLLKTIVLGCIWAIAMINIVFVFLFCVFRITARNSNKEIPSIIRQYPIVIWSNYILLVITIFTLWLYYIQTKNFEDLFADILVLHWSIVPILTVIIFAMLVIGGLFITRYIIKNVRGSD